MLILLLDVSWGETIFVRYASRNIYIITFHNTCRCTYNVAVYNNEDCYMIGKHNGFRLGDGQSEFNIVTVL